MLIVFIRCSLSLSLSMRFSLSFSLSYFFKSSRQLHFKTLGCLKEILLRRLWSGTVGHAFSLFTSVNVGLPGKDKYKWTNRKGVAVDI